MRRVVDEHRLAHVAAENVEVFEVVAINVEAGVAEKAIADVATLGIEQVQQLLCIDLLARREDSHLKLSRNPLQKLVQMRPLAHVNLVIRTVEGDREGHIRIRHGVHTAQHNGRAGRHRVGDASRGLGLGGGGNCGGRATRPRGQHARAMHESLIKIENE